MTSNVTFTFCLDRSILSHPSARSCLGALLQPPAAEPDNSELPSHRTDAISLTFSIFTTGTSTITTNPLYRHPLPRKTILFHTNPIHITRVSNPIHRPTHTLQMGIPYGIVHLKEKKQWQKPSFPTTTPWPATCYASPVAPSTSFYSISTHNTQDSSPFHNSGAHIGRHHLRHPTQRTLHVTDVPHYRGFCP